MTEKVIEKKAIKISSLDSNELMLFQKFSYGSRGDDWRRLSGDSILYACSYRSNKDTIEVIIFQPLNFINDFTCFYTFDTSKYHDFKFALYNDKIVRISFKDTTGQNYFIDTSLLVRQLFPDQNPFQKLAKLTTLKDSLGFIGTSYNSYIGDFIVFWLTPQYKLTYMPDTLQLNPASRKYWIDDFNSGKKIKEHWSLKKVYE